MGSAKYGLSVTYLVLGRASAPSSFVASGVNVGSKPTPPAPSGAASAALVGRTSNASCTVPSGVPTRVAPTGNARLPASMFGISQALPTRRCSKATPPTRITQRSPSSGGSPLWGLATGGVL
ncbi:hypothetical protein D3C71_1540340 [compost metagenome]